MSFITRNMSFITRNMSSTAKRIWIGVGVIVLVQFTLAGIVLAGTTQPETRFITEYVEAEPKIIIKTAEPEVITKTITKTVTKHAMPDVCVRSIEVANSIYESAVNISDVSTPQLDLMSDARIAIASKDMKDLSVLSEKQNTLGIQIAGYAAALSTDQVNFRSLRDECEAASK